MGIIGTCCSGENKKENLPLDSFSCRNCMQTFNRDIDPLGIQFFFCLIVLRISRMYILRMLLKDRRSIEGENSRDISGEIVLN